MLTSGTMSLILMWQIATLVFGGEYMAKSFAELRREAGYLRQNDLGKALNVDRSTISKWEAGTRYPLTIKLIALSKLLNCTEGDIIAAISNASKQPTLE